MEDEKKPPQGAEQAHWLNVGDLVVAGPCDVSGLVEGNPAVPVVPLAELVPGRLYAQVLLRKSYSSEVKTCFVEAAAMAAAMARMSAPEASTSTV